MTEPTTDELRERKYSFQEAVDMVVELCDRLDAADKRIEELEAENATLREHLSPTWHEEGVGPGRRD